MARRIQKGPDVGRGKLARSRTSPGVLVLNGGYLTTTPSGGDRHLLALASALADRDEVHGVRFVAPEWVRPWLSAGVTTSFYRAGSPSSTLGIVGAYLRRVLLVSGRLLLGRFGGKVVLASPSPVDLLPALLHRAIHGSRIGVFAFHLGDARAAEPSAGESGPRPNPRVTLSGLASRIELALLRRADRVFTSTEAVADELLAAGVAPDRLVRQLPIVAAEAVRAAPPSSIPAPDVLFVGRWVERKGVFDLVEAARLSTRTFAFVGDGEAREPLRQRISALGLEERVRLVGPLSDGEVYSLMRDARVLALPSYEEGYGLVVAEAWLAGTPAVAYALPHYDEVFGEALVQVPRGDVEALALALEGVVENPPAASCEIRWVDGPTAARQLLAAFGLESVGGSSPGDELASSSTDSGTPCATSAGSRRR